jgi:hypothetical protein
MPPDPFDRELFERYAINVHPKDMSNDALFEESTFLWRRLAAIAERIEVPPPIYRRPFFVVGTLSILAGIPGLWYIPVGVAVIVFGLLLLAYDTRGHYRQVHRAHTCGGARKRIERRYDTIQAEIKSRMPVETPVASAAPPTAAPSALDRPAAPGGPGPAGTQPV